MDGEIKILFLFCPTNTTYICTTTINLIHEHYLIYLSGCKYNELIFLITLM